MDSFWSNHTYDYIFLIGFTLFPRFSLLFCNISWSFFILIGWLFLPRITIAILATLFYSPTNPILVILSWMFALGGESAEKKYGYKMTKNRKKNKKENAEYEVINENE